MNDTEIVKLLLDIQRRLDRLESLETPTVGTIPTAANPTAQVGTATVNGTAATFMRSDAAPSLNAAAFTANPTASAGKTANNGTATTFMRSDASPAISDSDQTDGLHADATSAATAHLVATNSTGDINVVKATMTGDTSMVKATISGALTHTGTTAGFYNTAPITKQTATSLSDAYGTGGSTITQMNSNWTVAYADADNNFRSLTNQINNIKTCLQNLGLIA